jgi:ankyrin repeat protein
MEYSDIIRDIKAITQKLEIILHRQNDTKSAENGHLAVVKYLKEEFGLTKEDAQAGNNYALRMSAENGHLDVVKYLKEEFGLTKKDAQADDNYALRLSAKNGHLAVVKYLREEFGLTKEDAQAYNNAALRYSAHNAQVHQGSVSVDEQKKLTNF